FRGWGRSLKRAVGNWYLEKDADKLALQLTKYQQRNGWSHRDLLRLAHPVPQNEVQQSLFKYTTNREKWVNDSNELPKLIEGVERVKQEKNPKVVAQLVREYNLVREHLPTEVLNSVDVWEALLENMPMTAMVRNLGNMSKVGLLKPLSKASK